MTWRTSGWPGFGPNNFRGSVNVADGNVNVAGDLNLTDSAAFTTTLQCITPTANRTVSIPDATGTLGLIAGSSGNLIWNNAGAYAGALNSTVDSSGNITLGARLTNSVAAALSAPPVSVTGTWITTGGTATTTKPTVVIEPAGTTSTGWSTAGTGLGVNAPSGFAGRLLDLQLNGTTNFNVDSTGRVSFPLGTAALPSFYPGTDTNTGMWSPAADTLAWSTNGVERTRIDSSGRLLVGTSTSTSVASVDSALQIVGTGVDAFASLIRYGSSATNTLAPGLFLARSGSGTKGTNTIVANNNVLGYLHFAGANGSGFDTAVSITAEVDATPGASNDMPGRLVFSTTADGASSTTERLRITSAGVLQIADTGNIAVGTTTGTKIGTATTQKLGFYNATPVVQPTAVADITTTATAGTLPTANGTVTIADAAAPTNAELLEYCVELEAKLEAALTRLRDLGLIAT